MGFGCIVSQALILCSSVSYIPLLGDFGSCSKLKSLDTLNSTKAERLYFQCARTIEEEQWGQVMGSKRAVKLKMWFSHLNPQYIRYRS